MKFIKLSLFCLFVLSSGDVLASMRGFVPATPAKKRQKPHVQGQNSRSLFPGEDENSRSPERSPRLKVLKPKSRTAKRDQVTLFSSPEFASPNSKDKKRSPEDARAVFAPPSSLSSSPATLSVSRDDRQVNINKKYKAEEILAPVRPEAKPKIKMTEWSDLQILEFLGTGAQGDVQLVRQVVKNKLTGISEEKVYVLKVSKSFRNITPEFERQKKAGGLGIAPRTLGVPFMIRGEDSEFWAFRMEHFENAVDLKVWAGGGILHHLPGLAERSFEALNRLHRAGGFHHDIAPENILVLSNGEVQFIDFGLGEDEWGHPEYHISTYLNSSRAKDLVSLVLTFLTVAGEFPVGPSEPFKPVNEVVVSKLALPDFQGLRTDGKPSMEQLMKMVEVSKVFSDSLKVQIKTELALFSAENAIDLVESEGSEI